MIERRQQPEVDAGPEALLDLSIELTFPASDPIAVRDAYQEAQRREQSQKPDQKEIYP